MRKDFVDLVHPKLVEELADFRKVVRTHVEGDFDGWVKKVRAEKYGVPSSAMESIIDGYFEGTAPFKSEKNRVDFPDALIWATLLHIGDKVGVLHFVAQDGGWEKAVSDAKRITLHSSIDDFLLETIDELASQTDERLFELLAASSLDLERRVRDLVEGALQGKTVHSDEIPEDNNEARISTTSEPSELHVDVRNAENLGGGFFTFPFVGCVEVTLDYAIYKGDWALLDDDRALQMGLSALNGHYYEVEESATVWIAGNLDVQITYDEPGEDDYLSNAVLDQLVLNANYDIESIEVTKLRIHRAG